MTRRTPPNPRDNAPLVRFRGDTGGAVFEIPRIEPWAVYARTLRSSLEQENYHREIERYGVRVVRVLGRWELVRRKT